MKLDPRLLARAALGYVRKNPEEIVRATVNAATLKFGLPLAALRFIVAQAPQSKKMPQDIELGAVPPALRLSATVDAMGTALRVTAAVRIDDFQSTTESVLVSVRLSGVELEVMDDSKTPVATLVKSGALDLSKPGNLVKHLPKRPPMIVDAAGDRIVVDLLRVPALDQNRRAKTLLGVITPLLGIRAIGTEDDHVYVSLKATPAGLPEAWRAIRTR